MISVLKTSVSHAIKNFRRYKKTADIAGKRQFEIRTADDNGYIKTVDINRKRYDEISFYKDYIIISHGFWLSKQYVFLYDTFRELIVEPEDEATSSIIFVFSEVDPDWKENTVRYKKVDNKSCIKIIAEISDIFSGSGQVKIITE